MCPVNRKKFSLGVCQLRTETDYEATMEKAAAMIREAASAGADVLVLPEMFPCPYATEYFHAFASRGHEETCRRLSSWAGENRVLLVGGSVPEVDGNRLYNSCFVYGPDGGLLARHRKVHLFDVDLPGMCFHESHTFTPGSEITVFDTPYGRMGVAVCFEVRFPELFRAMARRGCELICLPAQFNMTTGPAHWEATMRMRAVDNELFFVAAAAARYEGFSYECWGHSLILDPFGSKLAEADETEQLILAELDLNRIDEVRLPASEGGSVHGGRLNRQRQRGAAAKWKILRSSFSASGSLKSISSAIRSRLFYHKQEAETTLLGRLDFLFFSGCFAAAPRHLLLSAGWWDRWSASG